MAFPIVTFEGAFEVCRGFEVDGGTAAADDWEMAGDRVTVLRNGVVVATRKVDELNHESLIELILGRKLDAIYPKHEELPGAAVLQVEHLSGGNLRDLSFSVRAGEIVGVIADSQEQGANSVE